jgi:hypothetical protein
MTGHRNLDCKLDESHLEMITHVGELTVHAKIREEDDWDVWQVSRERMQRPTSWYEFRYNPQTGESSNLSDYVGSQAATTFMQRFKEKFYANGRPGTELSPNERAQFELLVGGFDVHQVSQGARAFVLEATYHNGHEPGERVALELNGDLSQFTRQILELTRSTNLPPEMELETCKRIADMHSLFIDRVGVYVGNGGSSRTHPLAGQPESYWSEKVYLPWSE